MRLEALVLSDDLLRSTLGDEINPNQVHVLTERPLTQNFIENARVAYHWLSDPLKDEETVPIAKAFRALRAYTPTRLRIISAK